MTRYQRGFDGTHGPGERRFSETGPALPRSQGLTDATRSSSESVPAGIELVVRLRHAPDVPRKLAPGEVRRIDLIHRRATDLATGDQSVELEAREALADGVEIGA